MRRFERRERIALYILLSNLELLGLVSPRTNMATQDLIYARRM